MVCALKYVIMSLVVIFLTLCVFMEPIDEVDDAVKQRPQTPTFYRTFLRMAHIIPNRIDWNINGKTIIITGANTGLGKATALELAKMGMKRLILACKNVAAGEAAAVEIREKAGGLAPDVVAVRQLDLSSFDSIRKFAHDINTNEPDLHILINNAGYYGGSNAQRKMTVDGLELHFAVNYIGSYLLTMLLMNLLKRSSPSRIINVAAGAFWLRLARKRGWRVDDVSFDGHPGDYTPTQAYVLAKLAMVLFTRTLHRHLHPVLKDDGSPEELDLQLAGQIPTTLHFDPTKHPVISSPMSPRTPRVPRNVSSPVLSSMNRYSQMLAEDKATPLTTPASVRKTLVHAASISEDETTSLPPMSSRMSKRASVAVMNQQRGSVTSSNQSTGAPSPGNSERTTPRTGRRSLAAAPLPFQPMPTIPTANPWGESMSEMPHDGSDGNVSLNSTKKSGGRREQPIVSVFAVSPGSFLDTELYRHVKISTRRLMRPLFKGADLGAIMVVYCASANSIESLSGKYFVKCHPAEPASMGNNDALGHKLWAQSARLVDEITFKRLAPSRLH